MVWPDEAGIGATPTRRRERGLRRPDEYSAPSLPLGGYGWMVGTESVGALTRLRSLVTSAAWRCSARTT